MADQPKTADDVKAIVDDCNIRFVRLWFTDILGQLKSFSINAAELDDAFEGGMGFDGSSITGFNAIEESDMIAMPDISTFSVLPGGPKSGRSAHVLRRCHPQPRAVRGRPAPRRGARSSGPRRWASTTSTSARSSSTSTSATRTRTTAAWRCSTKAATSTSPRSTPAPMCAARPCSRSSSSASTWRYTHHEVGPSQHEIDMRYADALKMADDCMTYRITVKEYAMKYGWHATFMPKPPSARTARACTHQSLFKEDRKQFYDADDQYFLSDVGKSYIAGQLKHARDLLGVRAVGQLVQAARPRLRGARLLRLVTPQPLGARAGAAVPPRQRAGNADGAGAARIRRATPT